MADRSKCREEKGFSQAELAKQIDAYHSIIGKYERDEVKPTIDVVKELADVLNTNMGYLLGENLHEPTQSRVITPENHFIITSYIV
ncbi:MAG: helix-turn-helix transcriptional regulator [Cytophagales bacterium]|nr:helix-turn-helix transcriptional regulator [Cytophagales bacterium]